MVEPKPPPRSSWIYEVLLQLEGINRQQMMVFILYEPVYSNKILYHWFTIISSSIVFIHLETKKNNPTNPFFCSASGAEIPPSRAPVPRHGWWNFAILDLYVRASDSMEGGKTSQEPPSVPRHPGPPAEVRYDWTPKTYRPNTKPDGV